MLLNFLSQIQQEIGFIGPMGLARERGHWSRGVFRGLSTLVAQSMLQIFLRQLYCGNIRTPPMLSMK